MPLPHHSEARSRAIGTPRLRRSSAAPTPSTRRGRGCLKKFGGGRWGNDWRFGDKRGGGFLGAVGPGGPHGELGNELDGASGGGWDSWVGERASMGLLLLTFK